MNERVPLIHQRASLNFQTAQLIHLSDTLTHQRATLTNKGHQGGGVTDPPDGYTDYHRAPLTQCRGSNDTPDGPTDPADK